MPPCLREIEVRAAKDGRTARAIPRQWPFTWWLDWWKPTTYRRDLVKAGALILAEIERLDRREGVPSIDPSDVD